MRFRGLRLIVIGLLFLLIDINMSGFDAVPDPLGYGLIVAGLISLAGLRKAFAAAELVAMIALVISVFDMVLGFPVDGADAPPAQTCVFCAPVPVDGSELSVFSGFLSIVRGVSNVALVWLLGQGLAGLLAVRGLAREARATTACVSVNIVILVLGTVPFILILAAVPEFAFPAGVTGLAAGIWFALRLNRVHRVLNAFDAASLEAMAWSPDEGALPDGR